MRALFNAMKSRCKNIPLLAILSALLLFSEPGKCQQTVNEKPPLKERIFFGGNLALQVGTYSDIEILPVAGIWILPRIAVAAGPGYRFYGYEGTHTSVYSVRGYIQLVPVRDIDRLIPLGTHTSIILQLEDEALSLDSKFWHNVDLKPSRFFVNSIMAGPGISQQIGKKASINIVFMWSLNDTGYQLYSDPVIRVGIVF